jgi:hypothetical protein
MQSAELWIRLKDGRTLRECYNQVQMAEFIREAMVGCLERGAPLHCFDGEHVEIAAERVSRIELIVGHESAAPAVMNSR